MTNPLQKTNWVPPGLKKRCNGANPEVDSVKTFQFHRTPFMKTELLEKIINLPVSIRQLQKLTGLARSTVQDRLTAAGVKSPAKLSEALEAILRLRDREDYTAARSRRMQVQADLLELELRRKKKELVEADEMEEEFSARIISARREIQSWHDVSRERRSEVSRKLGDALTRHDFS